MFPIRVPVVLSLMAGMTLILLTKPPFAAEPVFGWRHNGTGQFQQVTPPVEWSRERHVVWQTAMPGRGIASPVLVEGRVLTTAEPTELVCLDADSGEVLWTRTHTYTDVFGQAKGSKIDRDLAQAKEVREKIESLKRDLNAVKEADQDAKSALEERIAELEKDYAVWAVYPPVAVGSPGNATSTPISDGENVWAVFGTGIVSSHAVGGQQNWMRFVEAPGSRHSASPLLSDGRLILHLNQLIALDAATGETVWQAATPPRAGTAVLTQIDGTEVVVTPAGAVVRASDGELLAQDLFNLVYCSPVVAGDVVYAVQNGSTKAIRLTHDDTGAVRPDVLWESPSAREHRLSSPVHHDGLLYSVTEKGVLDVLDAETGERIYRQRLKLDDGRFDSSLAIAGELLFVSSNQGKTLVMKPGREHVEVGRSELENFSSSPVFDRGRIYIRTQQKLYCLGQ